MMRVIPNQEEINERKDTWQIIRWRMNVHKVDPKELAKQTPYSQDIIERGIDGEPVPTTHPFLCACVNTFSRLSGRGNYPKEELEKKTISELVELLKPPPACPTGQGNFWDKFNQELLFSMCHINADLYPNKLTSISNDSEQANFLIIQRAKQLVNQLIENRGHDKPPFLPEEYVQLQGINNIIRADLGNLSGILLNFHDDITITVNMKHYKTRQNFSGAHEIGHILFNEMKLESYIKDIEYRTFNPQVRALARAKVKERLCDVAATELLMPEPIFSKYLEFFNVSIHSVKRLADIFRVSIRAAVRRIAEVSSEPCIALIWQPLIKTKTLCLAWCVGPGMKLQGTAQYTPVHIKVRHPSILHKAYEQDSPVKCYKKFKIGKDTIRLPLESKAFGRGENRYVVSLAFPER